MPSETGGRGHARSDPADAAVRAQLESMLASTVFARSPQLRSFLSYIVERRLAGQGHTLKESVLARELYGKGPDFDGGSDPVVRVDARRLRDKLREFYEGRTDAVVISLPKGSYVPFFEEVSAAQAEPAAPLAVTERKERRSVVHLGRQAVLIGALALAAVVMTAAIAWRALRPQEAAAIQMLPLASYPGAEGPPALSPDGNFVAFAWSGQAEPGPADIYVKAVGTEALRRLTDTPASEANPAWSPDGAASPSCGMVVGVVVMSQLGGSERQVSASGTHVAWAADSKSVLIRDREANTGPFGIFQVSLDTLERSRLTQAPVGIGDWRFDVSPDGRTLAFIRYERPGIADLHVVAMHGGEPRRLTNWNAGLTGLAWTPDGREIVFSVEQPSAARLWRINANTTRPGRGTPIPDIPVAAVMPSISRPKPGCRHASPFRRSPATSTST